MTRIEAYFPKAVRLVENPDYKLLDKNQAIASQYKGYISSFGSTILQCGLLPAVALFSKTDGRSEQNKMPLLEIIWELIKGDHSEKQLKDYLILLHENGNFEQLELEQARIMDAAVALKLAIRTFKIKPS